MYTITTTPGDRVDTADTIPEALAALASQLTAQLPEGPVAWCITDPAGTQHRGNGTSTAASICSPPPSTNSSTSCTPSCTGQPTGDHTPPGR